MKQDHYTYRVTWSQEDGEYVGLCAEFPSLSWLAGSAEKALHGIRRVVASTVTDMGNNGEVIPTALAEKRFSGEFRIRTPQHVHRALATEAGISLNRLASAKLSR